MGNVQDGGDGSHNEQGVPIDNSEHLLACLRADAETYHDTGQFRLAITNYKAICKAPSATSQDFLRLGEVYMNEIATQSATASSQTTSDPTKESRLAAKGALLEARRRSVTEEERTNINCLLDAIDSFAPVSSESGSTGNGATEGPLSVPVTVCEQRPLRFVECKVAKKVRTNNEIFYVFEFRGDDSFNQFLPSIAVQHDFSQAAFLDLAAELHNDGLWLHETPIPGLESDQNDTTRATRTKEVVQLGLELVENLANRLLIEVPIPRVLAFFHLSQTKLDEMLGRLPTQNGAKSSPKPTASDDISSGEHPFVQNMVVESNELDPNTSSKTTGEASTPHCTDSNVTDDTASDCMSESNGMRRRSSDANRRRRIKAKPDACKRRLIEGFLLKRPSVLEDLDSFDASDLGAFTTPCKPGQGRRSSRRLSSSRRDSSGPGDGRWQKRWFFFDLEVCVGGCAFAICFSAYSEALMCRPKRFATQRRRVVMC